MRARDFAERFESNEDLNKWLWFATETLVSAFLGTLIAFIFGSHYWAALVAFAVLMSFLVLLTVAFLVFENRVSVLSIMSQGLKDGKYEDVIKFGSAMRATLFTSNKNEEIVILAAKIDDAASKIESAHYNSSHGDYMVTVDGTAKSISLIRAGLRIDDLGWSMHLSRKADDATANILEGMKSARAQALRLSRSKAAADSRAMAQFVEMILRGYRHLCGIYYEDIKHHWKGAFYEAVTKIVMSNYRGVGSPTACKTSVGVPAGTTCGVFCAASYAEKSECSRQNILLIFFPSAPAAAVPVARVASALRELLSTSRGGLMSAEEIEQDTALFQLLSQEVRHAMAREQCYAWGRNIVKRILNGIYRQGESDFLSDAELSSLVAEARAFAQVYYYGTAAVPMQGDFDSVIKAEALGKSALRYASLINEIDLVNVSLPSVHGADSDGYGDTLRIEQLIDNLKSTREICRDKRGDLYVRASMHLITAYHIEYNRVHRYPSGDTTLKPAETRKKTLSHYKKVIAGLRSEIVAYEHKVGDDLKRTYGAAMDDLNKATSAIKKKRRAAKAMPDDALATIFSGVDPAEYEMHRAGARLRAATHEFPPGEIQGIVEKWGKK